MLATFLGPRRLKRPPRPLQEASKTVQDASKNAPDGPRRPKTPPNLPRNPLDLDCLQDWILKVFDINLIDFGMVLGSFLIRKFLADYLIFRRCL